jgi:hypothetical protein
MPGPRDFKVLKFSKRGGQRPEVKTLRVLGNQRLTLGRPDQAGQAEDEVHQESPSRLTHCA